MADGQGHAITQDEAHERFFKSQRARFVAQPQAEFLRLVRLGWQEFYRELEMYFVMRAMRFALDNREICHNWKRAPDYDQLIAWAWEYATKRADGNALRQVTVENVHEFKPARQKRSRPCVAIGGNVVAFRRPEPQPPTDYERQELKVAQLLVARRARKRLPVIGVDSALEILRSVVIASRDDRSEDEA